MNDPPKNKKLFPRQRRKSDKKTNVFIITHIHTHRI